MIFHWCLHNPDIACTLHAIRVELLIRVVMPSVVPHSIDKPFQFWARFEEGYSGNPHVHGLSYTEGSPDFDCVVSSEEAREKLVLVCSSV